MAPPRTSITTSGVDPDCPIPATHRRLGDVHELWHEAVESYFDPDQFRRKLNVLLQEVRNVTFVLKGEKHAIPDFDAWYAQWEQRMRGDAVMKWLRDARNEVTKHGDLATLSRARATVIRSWFERATSEAEVSPMLPMKAIVEASLRQLPQELREQGVLCVERRWIVESLPDHEILDAVAHGYGLLTSIIASAHERCGSEYMSAIATPHGPAVIPTGHLGQRLPCMAMPDAWRRVCIHLKTGDVLAMEQHFGKPHYEEAHARYADILGSIPRPSEIAGPDDFLRGFGTWVFTVAKRFLQRDGQHNSLLWTIGQDNGVHAHRLFHEDREELLLMMENLAEQAKHAGVWGVATVSEMWTAPFDPTRPAMRPSESPERREMLCVAVAVADGRAIQYMAPFTRGEAGIEFGDDVVDESGAAFDLQPFLRMWEARRR